MSWFFKPLLSSNAGLCRYVAVGHMQKKHQITSNFLLAKTSPYMAGSMLLFGGDPVQLECS
jgi:hypothetical protein